jgi:hypothetical protein
MTGRNAAQLLKVLDKLGAAEKTHHKDRRVKHATLAQKDSENMRQVGFSLSS